MQVVLAVGNQVAGEGRQTGLAVVGTQVAGEGRQTGLAVVGNQVVEEDSWAVEGDTAAWDSHQYLGRQVGSRPSHLDAEGGRESRRERGGREGGKE